MEIINTYKRCVPQQKWWNELDKVGNCIITALLTQDDNEKIAVYIGVGTDDFVLKYGLKLSYMEAKQYYPMLKEKDYRN